MNFDNLKTQTPEQLRELAGKMGLHIHHRAKPPLIIKQIMEAALLPQMQTEPKHVAELPQAPKFHNTPDDIEAALAPLKAKHPQFQTEYNTQENTWHFRCKGAEESGNMDIPMRAILQVAKSISRGRIALLGHPDFDRTNATGKNAYTNTVLAG